MEIEQIEPLLAKLSTLQIENAQLRDRNDEMVSEIECLGNQINAMRSKLSSTPTYGAHELVSEENVSVTCEGVGIGLGSKRRSDESPSNNMQTLGLGECPEDMSEGVCIVLSCEVYARGGWCLNCFL